MALIDPKNSSAFANLQKTLQKKIEDDLLKDSFLKFRPYDHQLDALNFSMRDLGADRIPMTHRAFREFTRFIDIVRLPVAAEVGYEPDFLSAFVWGPNGEWIGHPVTDEMERSMKTGSPSSRYGDTLFRIDIILGDQVVPYEDFMRGYGYHCNSWDNFPKCVRIADYTSLRQFIDRQRDGWFEPFHLELAGLIQNLHASDEAVNDWITAMQSTRYKLGYGCLRDARNRYDAFGILADLNGCPWTWNATERAWEIEGGDAYGLTEKQLREYLGYPEKNKSPQVVKTFLNRVPRLLDRLSTRDALIGAFKAAGEVISARRTKVAKLRKQYGRLSPEPRYLSPRDIVRADDVDRWDPIDYRGTHASLICIDDPLATFGEDKS